MDDIKPDPETVSENDKVETGTSQLEKSMRQREVREVGPESEVRGGPEAPDEGSSTDA